MIIEDKQPLVSIVIPAYNCEKYISKTLDSVINQTYWNLEIIVVNDCSKDKTEEIIKEYARRDPRIVYLKNRVNSGVAATRNRGIEKASGEWIALLDSDDYWVPIKIEKQISLILEVNGFLCCTGRELIDSQGEKLDRTILPPEEIQYENLLRTNSITCSSVICKTEVLKEFPMKYDRAHEDYIVWLSMTKKYGKVHGIREPLVYYRVMKNSKSGNKIKSLKMQYASYKHIRIGVLKRLYYLMHYTVNGILKYGL